MSKAFPDDTLDEIESINHLSRPVARAKPSHAEAMEAVKTLIRYTGEDVNREGLLDTPKRVVKSFDEFFAGYKEDPRKILERTFSEVAGYDEMVLLKNMRLESHCEHHMVPIIGVAHVAYIPRNRVVGISKLARVVDVFSKRLQTQERMTAEIASTIESVLNPKGVAVVIDAYHQCMTTRGVHKDRTTTITSRMLGLFKSDHRTRAEFMQLIALNA